MAKVVPTVLAGTPDEYAAMMQRARGLCARVHVDIADGQLAPTRTIGLAQVHIPDETELDLHLMVEDPAAEIENALSLKPSLIIFHAEASGNITSLMQECRRMGVKAGVALLPVSQPDEVRSLIETADHVLIFTGDLGHNGGSLQLEQLKKVAAVRATKPEIEISIDGGVSADNAPLIAMQGVDVMYSGGYLQTAEDPVAAYAELVRQAGVVV